MPQRGAAARRVAPSIDDRVSFELPASHEELEAALTRHSLNAAGVLDSTSHQENSNKPQGGMEESYEQWLERFPDAVQCFGTMEVEKLKGKHLALFLDYDGTLTPIVPNPDRAFISDEMRKTVNPSWEKP